MNEDESAKIRHNLWRAVVHTWTSTAAVALLVTAIPIDHVRGGELMECEPQPVHGDGRRWAYRIIDGRECWYPGERGKPKGELHWPEAKSAPQQSRVLEHSGVEGGPPESPAPQQAEQSEASPAQTTVELPAASPEPDTIEAMSQEWRSAAADQLLAFTCCWPELPEAAPLPQPGLERRQDLPAWQLILVPLALCAMWSTRKLAAKSLRWLLAPDFGRPSVPPWWRWWQIAVSLPSLCRRRKAQQKGPAGDIASASTKAYLLTKLACTESTFVPLAPRDLSSVPRGRWIPPAAHPMLAPDEARSTLIDRNEAAIVPRRQKGHSPAL